jgi:hypothetical protein
MKSLCLCCWGDMIVKLWMSSMSVRGKESSADFLFLLRGCDFQREK